MPGVFNLSIDEAVKEVDACAALTDTRGHGSCGTDAQPPATAGAR